MKKKIKIIALIILTLFISLNNVNAESFKKGMAFTKSSETTVAVNGLTSGGVAFSTGIYGFSANGSNYVGYCMDPYASAATNYTVDRILGDNSNGELVQAFDHGVLTILIEGYNQINPNKSSNGLDGNSMYVATSTAIRAFTMLFPGFGKSPSMGGATGIRIASSYANISSTWAAANSSYTNQITKLSCSSGDVGCYQNYMKSTYSSWYSKDAQFAATSGSNGAKIMAVAQELYNKGIEAAIKFLNGESTDPNATLEIKNTETAEKSGNKATEYVYAEFQFTNIDNEKGSVTNVQYSCEECSSKGITIEGMEYQSESGNWTAFTSSDDVSKFVPEENGKRTGTLKIRLRVSKTVTEDECNSAEFKITYDVKDEEKQYVGALLKVNNGNSYQRFLVITAAEGAVSNEVKGNIGCAKEACDTELSVPICSTDPEDAIATVKAPENIKKCILDNEDDAGNSYELNTNVSDEYCSVFCKEDYSEIKLNPIVEDVVCGGYFQLKSHVRGNKDCYTSGKGDKNSKNGANSIDKEAYLRDIKEVQEDLVEAMNNYYKYSAMVNATVGRSYTVPATCDGDDCEIEITPISWGRYNKITFNWNESTESGSFRTGSEYGDSINFVGECPSGYYSCDFDRSPYENYSDLTYEAWLNEQQFNLTQSQNILTNLMDDYKRIIANYNSCTTAWTNEYNFKPEIKYYYNEYHYNGVYEPYYELLQKVGDDKVYYLEGQGESTLQNTITVCTGKANENYECEGNSITLDGSVDGTADEYNYNSAYGNVFEDKNYVICTVDEGCKTDTRQVSKASFVKKSIEKEQDYITPTVFYQIEANGRITVNSGYTGDKVQLEALVNSLPVSTSTTGGGVFKLLIEELGEFYDTGELGRLMDFGGDKEANSVAYAQESKGIETFDGNYECYYESPCRPSDCPNCDFVCEDGDCVWNDCLPCNFSCVNCIFNWDELQLNFKPISPTNVHSADREYGYNWITTTTIGQLELLSNKAEATINEIESINEAVYDKTSTDNGLAFSIKLTPDMISKIKQYNKQVENEGGYANDSLTCYDDTEKGYKNIYCYSDYLDELINEFGDSITVSDNRISSTGNRKENSATSNYWKLWDISSYDESVIGGPSWK